MSDHCFSRHGWKSIDVAKSLSKREESLPCGAGRGPLYFEFREHMMRKPNGSWTSAHLN